jgi:hypothetical protein
MLTEQEILNQGFHNVNHVTGRLYLWLKNQMKLNEAGFAEPERMTFLQVKTAWRKLKKWSEGIEVIHTEPVEESEMDEEGNMVSKIAPRVTKHILFNVTQVDKESSTKQQQWNTTYTGNPQNIYGDQITQKQRLFLIRLIEQKYNDERTKANLLNRVNDLSKVEAKQVIQKMLAEGR